MSKNWNTVPGNTPIQDGETLWLNPSTHAWESHKFATTKADVGLGDVDNTSDADKPISDDTQAALDTKAATDNLSDVAFSGDYQDLLNKPSIPPPAPVDSVNGQTGAVVLIWEDVSADPVGSADDAETAAKAYTDGELSSLAEVARTGSYDDLADKPTLGSAAAANSSDFATSTQGALADTATQPGDLAPVATSGAYADLSGKPTIPAAQIQSDWNQNNSGSADYIKNKPSIPSVPTYSQSPVSRSLNSAFRPSTTRNILASYSIETAAQITISGGQSITVYLEISADGSTGWTEISRISNGNSGTLIVGVSLTQTLAQSLVGTIPAGYYARIRSSATGSATATYRSGQETALL